MSKPLGIKLSDYCKVVRTCIGEYYGHLKDYPSGGSVYTFEVFINKDDDIPTAIWNVHHEHNKKKELWSKQDLRKIFEQTKVPKERFVEELYKVTRKKPLG